jgi:hypothetical protein
MTPPIQVNATTITVKTNHNINEKLAIIHLKLPIEQVRNLNVYNVQLVKIKQFLLAEFLNNLHALTFEISATYNLVHETTGDIREFTGSFYPGSTTPASMTNNMFLNFEYNSFENVVKRYTNEDRARRILQQFDPDTKYQFHSLTSFIINVQIILPENHQFLINRRLTHVNPRRRQRHVQFFIE